MTRSGFETGSGTLHRLVLLACLGMPTLAAGQDIPVQLLFDGKPLRITAAPNFTCLDRNSHKWIGCRITPDPATDGYVMERPAPGSYTLHIEIDEDGTNPGRFPGDYDVFHPFEVTADAPAVLRVDVPKLMHVTSPWDNNRNMDGMLTRPWSEKPAIEPGSRSTSRTALVTFTWNAVADGAEYRYVDPDHPRHSVRTGARRCPRHDSQDNGHAPPAVLAGGTLLRVRDLRAERRTPGRRLHHARRRRAGLDVQIRGP